MITSLPPKPAHRLMGLSIFMFALSLLSIQSAGGHAVLLSSTPTDGMHLESSPNEIVLQFSESVGIVDGGFVLHSSDGDSTTMLPEARGSSVRVPLDEPLPDGAYALQWRVISADSHPIAGTISFTIGDSGGENIADIELGAPTWVKWGHTITVGLTYLGLLTAVALPLMARSLAPLGVATAVRLTSTLTTVAIVGILAGLPLNAILLEGQIPPSLGDLWRSIHNLESSSLIASLAGSVLALMGFLALTCSRLRTSTLFMAGALMTLLLTGHSRTRGSAWIMMLSDAVHLLAAAIWLGGIVILVMMFAARGRDDNSSNTDDIALAVSRFSTLAGYALAGVVVSGVVMAITILDSWEGLFRSEFGQTLLIKIGCVGILIALAAANRYWFIPRISAQREYAVAWLRRLIVAELILLVVVVGVTAVLVQKNPNVESRATSSLLYFDQRVRLDSDHELDLTIAQSNENTIVVTAVILDSEGAPVVIDDDLQIGWFLPERNLGPINQVLEADLASGNFQGTVILPATGEWQVEVKAKIDRFTDSRAIIEVEIPED